MGFKGIVAMSLSMCGWHHQGSSNLSADVVRDINLACGNLEVQPARGGDLTRHCPTDCAWHPEQEWHLRGETHHTGGEFARGTDNVLSESAFVGPAAAAYRVVDSHPTYAGYRGDGKLAYYC